MRKKRLMIAIACIILVGIAVIVFFSQQGKKPYKDLDAAQIVSAKVLLTPPDKTIEIENIQELVEYLNDVVVYNEDNSYTEYDGQGVVFTLTMVDGTQTDIMAYNPFIVIDGIGYKTKYEPCEALNSYANELLNSGTANIILEEPPTLSVVSGVCWLIKLQQDGRGYSSIHSIRGVVRPAFQMAVDDDLIRKNPFEFQLTTVVVNDSVTREAITRKQERAFLEFVASDKHFCKYYDGIYILFKTGLRISEFVGLTLADVDMKNRKININHQLQRKRNMEYIIEDTKTSSGTRVIPMTDDVYECFKRIIANRKKPKVEPMICGKSGFLYLDKNDMPMVALHWEKYFQHICEKYNSIYKVQMPKITPHVCRHTFCSNMAKSGMNPKTLQYIMGHSDIGVTLNTYTHIGFEDAQEELQRVANAE